jgi:predicted metal-dependent hydrolase
MRRGRAESVRGEVRRWAAKIGVVPKRVQIQRMTRKWASCSTSGRIYLSRDLLRESKAFREIVIVHELLHLSVPNHGKLFKSLMNAYLPNWEERARRRLARMCGYK